MERRMFIWFLVPIVSIELTTTLQLISVLSTDKVSIHKDSPHKDFILMSVDMKDRPGGPTVYYWDSCGIPIVGCTTSPENWIPARELIAEGENYLFYKMYPEAR